MADSGGISGIAVAAAMAGGIFLYSGLKGKSISVVLRDLIEGKNPSTAAQDQAINIGSIANSSDSPTGSGPLGSLTGTTGTYNGPDWATKQYAANSMDSLSFSQISQLWVMAGGPASVAPIAAAITAPESGRRPGRIQLGEPYATTGWGLWQITPGNSVPSAGTDNQLLVPINNAHAAVAKYKAAGGFSPWVTYENGAYKQFLVAAGGS